MVYFGMDGGKLQYFNYRVMVKVRTMGVNLQYLGKYYITETVAKTYNINYA